MFARSASKSVFRTHKYNQNAQNFETNPMGPVPGSETHISRKKSLSFLIGVRICLGRGPDWLEFQIRARLLWLGQIEACVDLQSLAWADCMQKACVTRAQTYEYIAITLGVFSGQVLCFFEKRTQHDKWKTSKNIFLNNQITARYNSHQVQIDVVEFDWAGYGYGHCLNHSGLSLCIYKYGYIYIYIYIYVFLSLSLYLFLSLSLSLSSYTWTHGLLPTFSLWPYATVDGRKEATLRCPGALQVVRNTNMFGALKIQW